MKYKIKMKGLCISGIDFISREGMDALVNNNEITITKIINDKIMEYDNREDIMNNSLDIMRLVKGGIHEEKLSSSPFPIKQLIELLTKSTKEKLSPYAQRMNADDYIDHYERALQVRLKRETEEQLKQKKMKTKKFYHTFDFRGREITLLLAVKEDQTYFFKENDTATVSLTYSVRLHEDEEIEGLTKKIAIGRLEKGKLLDNFRADSRFAFKLAYLKGLAFCFENEIKRGDLEIVGVTNGVAKEMKNEREQVFQETIENLGQ
jgi:uncharacterized glyoxalase superfamily protein PhnB